MATTRLTLGAVLDTVSKAASTANDVLDTVSNSVGMVNSFVKKHATEQEANYKADAKIMIERIKLDKATEIADMRRQSLAYCKQSEEHKNMFEKAYNEMCELFA